MKHLGFELAATGLKSYLDTGVEIPSSSDTRGSSAPTVSPIHEPNDIPAAHSGACGYFSRMNSSPALKSAFSPASPSKAPALRPAPRKLNRRTAQPIRASALVA